MKKLLDWSLEESNLKCAKILNPFKTDHIEFVEQADGVFYYENFLKNKPIAENWLKDIKKSKFPKFALITDEKNIPRINSCPSNIIECFNESLFLEGLALVIMWGTMTRTKNKIYTKNKNYIEDTIKEIKKKIIEENRIEKAWKLLTENLNWSNVMSSKFLHFFCRSLGYKNNPPVPIDNAIVKNIIWKEFNLRVGSYSNLIKPKDWFENNSFESYNRYMTVINYWAKEMSVDNTTIEVSLFNYYQNN
ncbi:MAG: hypothetical protein KA146_07040 [Leptospiraceae bacterium]|nr:hypothetical protein [Leptospiraceae bacterium]